MRASKILAALLVWMALLTSGVADAQAFRPGRAAGFRAGFQLASLPAFAPVRSTYTVPITSTGSFSNIVRWAESRRGKLWLRNPVGSPGSIRIGTKAGVQNKGIDTNTTTALYTLAPGEELYEENGGLIWLAWSADSTAPANLRLQVEVETLAAAPTAALTRTQRTITPSGRKLHALVNITTYSDMALIGLSKDGSTVFRRKPGASTTLGWASASAFAADPTGVVWTYGNNTVGSAGTPGINGLIETSDGEMLAFRTNGSFSNLWRSSGWSSNRQTATWTQVFAGPQKIDPEYSAHQWTQNGSTIIVADSGPQTAGGSGNDTTDNNRAVKVWRSTDDGRNWSVFFNLRDFATTQGFQYPAGVHIHGVSYDKAWDRYWIAYGDDTGQGKDIAGLSSNQLIYSDDAGSTWTKLALFDNWLAPGSTVNSNQHIAVIPLDDAIVFTADVSKPVAPFVVRRAGYRQFGPAELVGSVSQWGLNGRVTNYAGLIVSPGLSGSFSQPAGSYTVPVMLSADGLSWTEVLIPHTITATGSTGTLFGFAIGSKVFFQESNSLNVIGADWTYQ